MAIQFIGSAVGVTTATLPPHQSGDYILVFAYNDNATTVPALPAGYTSVNAPAGGNANAHRLAGRIAQSANEALGTWTGATQIVAHVYRGVDPTNPTGSAANLTNVVDVNYPAITLSVADGTSWVVAIHGRRTGNVENAAVPPGTVLRSDTGTSTAGRILGYDTSSGVTSWPQLATGGNNQFRYRSISVELRAAAVQGRSAAAAITLGSLSITSTGRVSLRASLACALGSVTTVSAGKLGIRAGGSGNLASLTAQAVGRVLAKGSAAIALDGVTIVARSRSPGRAQLDTQLGDATASASGRSARRAAAGIRLGDLTTVSSGAVQAGEAGRVSGQLGAVTLQAVGRLRARGSVAVRLADLGAGIVGRITIAARVAAQIGTLTVSAIGRRIVPQKTPADRVVRVAAEIRTVRVAPQLRVVRVHAQEVGMRQALTWPAKDPDEVLDYQIDWSARLAGDTITAAEWDLPAGIEADREDRSATATTIWLAGGEPGRLYRLTNRITTASGRVMEQAVQITTTGR